MLTLLEFYILYGKLRRRISANVLCKTATEHYLKCKKLQLYIIKDTNINSSKVCEYKELCLSRWCSISCCHMYHVMQDV